VCNKLPFVNTNTSITATLNNCLLSHAGNTAGWIGFFLFFLFVCLILRQSYQLSAGIDHIGHHAKRGIEALLACWMSVRSMSARALSLALFVCVCVCVFFLSLFFFFTLRVNTRSFESRKRSKFVLDVLSKVHLITVHL